MPPTEKTPPAVVGKRKRGRPRKYNGPSPRNPHPVVRVEVELETKNALDALCQRRGMTQVTIMTRLVNWVAKQDETIQAVALGFMTEEIARQLGPSLLERMASGKTSERR